VIDVAHIRKSSSWPRTRRDGSSTFLALLARRDALQRSTTNLHDDTRVRGNTLDIGLADQRGVSRHVTGATYGPQLSSLLADGASDGRSLHLTLGVDNDTSVVLEVQEDTISALPGLGLSDNDGGVDLLAELGLSLLDGGHNHVTDTAGRQSVQAGTDTLDGDDVEVTSTRVVGAVHDGTAVVSVSMWLAVLQVSSNRASGSASIVASGV
jgi:hypothetical protein